MTSSEPAPPRSRSRPRRMIRGLVLAAAILVAVDGLSGLVYRTGTSSTITVLRRGDGAGAVRLALVVLPGHLMSGRYVGQGFLAYVPDGTAVIAVDYGERGVDVDDIRRRLDAVLSRLAPARLVVYGPSLGGVTAAALLRTYARDGAPHGRVTLVLDSAPTGDADVKRPGLLLAASCYVRGGVLSSLVMAAVSTVSAHPPTAPDADPTVVARANRAGASMGTAAATSQACFLHRSSPPQVGELGGVVERAGYLHGSPATDDPIIDIPAAITHWRVALPSLTVVELPGRHGSWHVTPAERPKETVDAVLAVAAGP